MAVEISSTDKETIEELRVIAATKEPGILDLPIKPMEGKELFTLVIENFGTLSIGTTALIVALKNRVDYLKITKNGLEMKVSDRKKQTLDGK